MLPIYPACQRTPGPIPFHFGSIVASCSPRPLRVLVALDFHGKIRGRVLRNLGGPLTKRRQTLYIYFSVAILVGVFAGASLHYSINYIVTSLKLDATPEGSGRSLATYRAQKAERRARKATRLLANVGRRQPMHDGSIREQHSEWSKQNRGLGTKGLLSTTIIEEDDSSETGF